MAKDYNRGNKRRKAGAGKQLLLVFFAFICGYLSSSLFNFHQLSDWIGSQILAQNRPKPSPKTVQRAELPKPKFEFYTLLANEKAGPAVATPITKEMAKASTIAETAVNNAVSPAPEKKVQVAEAIPVKMNPVKTVSKENYVLQVAAFRTRPEAERLKASLTLKAHSVQLVAVSAKGVNWFRVMVGPFPSKALAEKARVDMARNEKMQAMLRKLDV